VDKRLIKNNLLFFVVSGIALGITSILICVSLIQYIQARSYISQAGDYREQIEEFGKKNPAPVEGNRDPLLKDTDLFTQISREMRTHFGFPYHKAVNRFIEVLDQPLPAGTSANRRAEVALEQFLKIYKEELGEIDAKEYAEVGIRWDKLKARFVNWKKASAEFAVMVQKASLEPFAADDTGVVDEILRSAFRMPRYLQGKPENLRTFILNYKYRVNDLLARAGVKVLCSPDFGFPADSSSVAFSIEEYPNIIRQWDVIGDLARRMVAAKIGALNEFIIRFGNEEGGHGKFDSSFVESGSYEVAHYTLEVTGSLNTIRQFARELNSAYDDNRIYVIRSVFLYAVDDGARSFFSQTIAGSDPAASARKEVRSGRGRGRSAMQDSSDGSAQDEQTRARMLEAERLRLERENSLAYYERAGYGQAVIGATDMVRAVFDIDYVVLKK